jgi:hypothetical protein
MNPFLTTIIFLFFCCQTGLMAQEAQDDRYERRNSPNRHEGGNVNIHQDARIDTLLKRHIAYNQHQDGIEGYRVHIFFDAGNLSLNRATQAAGQFQELYPGDTAYISFSEPYYRVRVGDFRTRLDAEGYLQKIIRDYPNAFVIRDRINFPRLED